jgi:hypothetical protein
MGPSARCSPRRGNVVFEDPGSSVASLDDELEIARAFEEDEDAASRRCCSVRLPWFVTPSKG